MEYLIVNMSFKVNSLDERKLDNSIFKEFAYNSKIAIKLPKVKSITYNYILIPIDIPNVNITDEFSTNVCRKITSNIEYNEDILKVLFKILDISYELITSIDIIGRIDDTVLGISYSDGSFQKTETREDNTISGRASYGVIQLEDESPDGELSFFTNKKYNFKEYSGLIEVGTNNVGELSGIKFVSENFNDKDYQVIISDSQYSINSFREWIYNWKNNGYRGSQNKPIKNKTLIVDTHDNLKNSKKIIFYKWTEGHADDAFNNRCDILAKDVLK